MLGSGRYSVAASPVEENPYVCVCGCVADAGPCQANGRKLGSRWAKGINQQALDSSGSATGLPSWSNGPNAVQVSGPTSPVCLRLFSSWKAITAPSVCGPKSPSTPMPSDFFMRTLGVRCKASTNRPLEPDFRVVGPSSLSAPLSGLK